MSVAEIKEEMKRLSDPELIEIEKLAAALRKNSTDQSPRVCEIQLDDPGVSERMDAVLQKHHNLLRRLAQ